jgi:drug/metabolite transporter (DMT)-like permease
VLPLSYPVGAALMAAFLPLYPGPLSMRTVLWSTAGGVAGLTGVAMLYAALAMAPMNVVSPVTGVLSAVVPVVAGVLFGERPHITAWVGIGLGLGAVVLVSRSREEWPAAVASWRPVAMALLAGVGFGAYFVCLARSDTDSGLWPVVVSRCTSALLVVPLAAARRRLTRMPAPVVRLAAAAGALDATANITFLLASRYGLLSLAGVITALYPAGTVLLAVAVLKERIAGVQRWGLVIAAVSVVLLTR